MLSGKVDSLVINDRLIVEEEEDSESSFNEEFLSCGDKAQLSQMLLQSSGQSSSIKAA